MAHAGYPANLESFLDWQDEDKNPLRIKKQREMALNKNRGGEAGDSRLIVMCSLGNLINAADRVIMPVAIIGLGKEHGYSLEQQGWVLSAFPLGYISSQVVGSCAGRQLGSWRLLLCVVLMWSLATLATPLVAPSLHLLILTRVVLGLGEGLGLPTIYSIFAESLSPQRRPRGFGYLSAMGSVGQTLAALLSPQLPWRLPFYFCGMAGILWCIAWIPCRSICQPSTLPHSQKMAQPELFGLLRKSGNPMRQWRELLTSSPLVAVYVAHFSMNWTAYIVMHWLPTYLHRFLQAKESGLSLACLPYLANSFASIAVGHLAEHALSSQRLGLLALRRLATGLGLALPALLLFVLGLVTSLPVAVFLVSASMAALALNSAGHLANHAELCPKLAGVSFAISNTLATLPGLLVGPLTARLVTEGGGRWWPVFLTAGMLDLTGAVVYMGQAKASQVI